MNQDLTSDAGGRFAVELEEAAGTGYRWTPVTVPAGIRLEGDEVMSAEPRPGGARRRVFRFAAPAAGRYQIDFELKWPWEEEAVAARQVQVRVGA